MNNENVELLLMSYDVYSILQCQYFKHICTIKWNKKEFSDLIF